MMDLDVAVQTKLANTNSELNGEIAAFGNSKGALKTFLQEQYKSRILLRGGVYNTIPVGSEYRSKTKPYRLRMNPFPTEGKTNRNDTQIAYLKSLLSIMMAEGAQRPLEPTAQPQDAKHVRNFPQSKVDAPQKNSTSHSGGTCATQRQPMVHAPPGEISRQNSVGRGTFPRL